MRMRVVLALLLLGPAGPRLAAAGEISITVTIQQLVAVGVTAPTDQQGDPGDVLTYLFTAQNTGTGPDAFNLRANSSERFAVALPGGASTPLLNPGDSAQVTVELTIPDGEPAGTQDLLTLEATSQVNRKISGEASVTTTVNQVAGVAMRPPQDQRGRPGETLRYRFRVENAGNGTDRFRLAVSSSQGLPVSLPGGELTGPLTAGLGGSSRTTVTVNITIPPAATAGAQDVLTLTAASELDPAVSTQASATSTVVVRGGGPP